jgi:purine catabolism regulator
LSDIISGRYGSVEALHARTASLGHPTYDRTMLPLVVLAGAVDLGKVMPRALSDAHLDALTADLGNGSWGVLLLFPPGNERGVDAFAERLHELCGSITAGPVTMARGAMVDDLSAVKRSFAEALETAKAVQGGHGGTHRRACYSIQDVQLRGLLYTLRDDPRLQAFVERQLGPLLVRDERDGGDWVHTLAVYLRLRGNKSLAANELSISRPTLYERLSRIQRLLHVDLDDPESSTSLYAAIMFAETSKSPGPAAAESSGADPPLFESRVRSPVA